MMKAVPVPVRQKPTSEFVLLRTLLDQISLIQHIVARTAEILRLPSTVLLAVSSDYLLRPRTPVWSLCMGFSAQCQRR